MKMHPSITDERISDAVEQDCDQGFCIACGNDAYGVEPDARRYKCEACGDLQVYGAEELLFHISL